MHSNFRGSNLSYSTAVHDHVLKQLSLHRSYQTSLVQRLWLSSLRLHEALQNTQRNSFADTNSCFYCRFLHHGEIFVEGKSKNTY